MTLAPPPCPQCPQTGSVLHDSRTRRVHGRVLIQRLVVCACGHRWWTQRFDRELRLEALLERQRQLTLPLIEVPIASLRRA